MYFLLNFVKNKQFPINKKLYINKVCSDVYMEIESTLKIVGKILKQDKKPYIKPMQKFHALKEDVVIIGNKVKTLQILQTALQKHLISASDFKKEMLSLHFTSNWEQEKFTESAKVAENLFDKKYIETYKTIQQYARRDGNLIMSYDNIPKIMYFIKTDAGFNTSMQDKIIEFLKTCPKEYTKSLANLCYYKDNSPSLKEKILDLNLKIHNEFDDIKVLHDYGPFQDNFTRALIKYVNKNLPEEEMLRRIEKLSAISENVIKISPFSDLINSINFDNAEYEEVQNDLVQRFLNLNIMPTEYAVKKVTSGSFESRKKFFNIMKPLTDLEANSIAVYEYTIEHLLKNKDKTILENIIKFIKSNKNYKDYDITICENSLNPKEYQIDLWSNKSKKCYIFNKKTHKLTSTIDLKSENTTSSVNAKNFGLKREVKNLNIRNNGTNGYVIDETIIQKTKTGTQKYTEYTKESQMEGQFDIYRILPSGKIKVLGKSFKDPITGETIIKRNFISPNKANVLYNYSADKIGNYDFNYIIKNQKGDVIMNQTNTQKILGKNHYLSVVNGQKYEIKLNKHLLKVIPEGQKPININLKEIVDDSVDSKIYNTITQLPADEILNLKKFNVKIVKCLDENNAQYTGKKFGDNQQYIEIGNKLVNSKFVLLHELGHLKENRISDADYKKILRVYKQEVEKIRNSITKSEQKVMSYLIDTEHYLNERKGAVEELVADANAQISVINDSKIGDIGVRTIKTQEYLPETLAVIAEVLAKV